METLKVAQISQKSWSNLALKQNRSVEFLEEVVLFPECIFISVDLLRNGLVKAVKACFPNQLFHMSEIFKTNFSSNCLVMK